MATTDRIGSLVGCLSELAHGSAALADAARSSAIVASADPALAGAASLDAPASLVAGPLLLDAAADSPADRWEADSEAVLAVSMAVGVSTVEAAFTEAVVPTEVAVSTGVDTGNYIQI